MTTIFIKPAELSALRDPIVLDIRFDPGKGAAPARYRDGHIPGAIFVDLPVQLANRRLTGRGSNPLPELAELQSQLRAWGVRDGSTVVVLDDSSGGPGARAWWVLRWAGVGDVRILEGGLAAWKRAGLELETGSGPTPAPGDITLRPNRLPHLEAEQVAGFQGTLVDARPRADFAKHIPGAVSLPISELVDAAGAVLPPDRLRALLAANGIDAARPVAAYCGGGVASTFLIAVLAELGIEAALYPGSWSEWTADPARPVAA